MENANSMYTIGVVGLGSVGSAMIHSLSKNNTCVGYDILGEYNWDRITRTDLAVICVPTPLKEGRLDNSIVDSVLKRLDDDRYRGIVVIKSTLGMGAMSTFRKNYSSLRTVYMPEFLRELNPYSWCENPDRVIISGNEDDCDAVISAFNIHPSVPVLRMSHSETELGKLAHNAFIATKVSFTNAIEMISHHCKADPENVMSAVWTDRRVKSNAHLMPGIGGYSGKCIPKDTSELLEFSRSEDLNTCLLQGVEDTNDSVRPSVMSVPATVHVIIPTSQQDCLVERAIASVCSQSIRPKELVVVYDEPMGEELRSIIKRFEDIADIIAIPNAGIRNLSGAVNTGLAYLREKHPADDFVALLDDDDYWGYRYLQNCLTFAHDMKCDWVVSGLIRIDNEHPHGAEQTIPKSLEVRDFLIGNPNVQGSNLFVKLGQFIKAGGFDESLVSTTDRDVCIRLLDLKEINAGFLRNHMVYHDCISRDHRLSTYGSDRKKEGLTKFFRKYSSMMGAEERRLFKERAYKLFDVVVSDEQEECD